MRTLALTVLTIVGMSSISNASTFKCSTAVDAKVLRSEEITLSNSNAIHSSVLGNLMLRVTLRNEPGFIDLTIVDVKTMSKYYRASGSITGSDSFVSLSVSEGKKMVEIICAGS